MPDDSSREEYLELYKLHSEFADRVSQRRDAANRLHVTLIVGLALFVATIYRFGPGGGLNDAMLMGISALGVFLSISWLVVIRSYKQLNSEKFRVLHELETHLVFAFFTREWDPEESGEKSNRYWRLTHVETGLPVLLGLAFVALFIYMICASSSLGRSSSMASLLSAPT